MPPPAIEAKIDDLYRAPLADFVSARTALAKSLTGDDAKRVRALTKPTVVPWSVNQVYWRARPLYDRLIKSGERLRDAQVAALEGHKADVRAATDAHRRAVADAVREAESIARDAGVHPATDALMRTFEALSLRPENDDPPGRLTKPLQPAGFEALAGVKVAAQVLAKAMKDADAAKAHAKAAAITEAPARAENAAERRKAEAGRKKEEAARKKREAAVKRAEAALERAKKRMAEAQAELDQTRAGR